MKTKIYFVTKIFISRLNLLFYLLIYIKVNLVLTLVYYKIISNFVTKGISA